MSVPPLVCSTPPPPDQVEEEGYNDEFTFNYVDLSPTHEFEAREYPLYDTPSPRDKMEHTIYVSPSNISVKHQQDAAGKLSTQPSGQIPSTSPPDVSVEIIPNEIEVTCLSEDSNVEDLDLKLDSLHIDFENERVTVEESLNSTFDDFGTFLSNTDFIPKLENTFSESDKESKSHGTCSEESTSLHNEDWDNISQNSFNANLNALPDQDDVNYIKKDNNDNIPKDALMLNSPDDIITSYTVKETSIDSGFKSSVNNSNDQIHIMKSDQPDSKSDNDISVMDANSLSFSECHEPDNESQMAKDVEDEDDLSIDVSQIKGNEINHISDTVKGDEFGSFTEAEIDFKANFHDEVGNDARERVDSNELCSFTEVNQVSEHSYLDSKINLFNEKLDWNVPGENDISDSYDNVSCNNIDNSNIKNITSHLDITSEGDDFDDFAEFQAEPFQETKLAECKDTDVHIQKENCTNINNIELDSKTENHDDDDFGDFDTYDPTITKTNKSDETSEKDFVDSKSYTVNDLVFSNDADVMEILKTAVAAIYHEDSVSEETNEDYQLSSSLGGSWKYLKEYETKQSYLFPWNNSTSQKTLLKSLGIDSRNILFGPKWNSNMPRFAANLGASPLQPIKQTFPALSSDYQREEKPSSNVDTEEDGTYIQQKVGEWQGGENFSMGENQASSYAESLLLDLEHLMATLDQMTSGQSPHFKISDLFTNACNEREDEHIGKHTKCHEPGNKFEKHQPPSILNIGRKINLPDTHIFTPTDSETPWSHTIHYEDTSSDFVPNVPCSSEDNFQLPTIETKLSHIPGSDDFDDFQSHNVHQYHQQESSVDMVPQLNEPSKDNLESFPVELLENRGRKVALEKAPLDESDDFGDFHSATTIEAVVHRTEILPPVSVLQPVRVTPSVSVPVVNWPEPGDVDTSVFHLTDTPIPQPTLPSWVENQETPSWSVGGNAEKSEPFENKDLHIPPYVHPKHYSPGSTSFILKETRIDSVDANDLPVQDKKHISNTDIDDFTDFQSVSPVPVSLPALTAQSSYHTNTISTTHITNNTAESVFSNNVLENDDFDDFQAVQYTPSQSNVKQMNTTSFISTPQVPNYFLPTTLGESFLKADTCHSFSSMPFQRPNELPTKSNPQQQQILQPLSLENFSQINWPNPGIDLQDLSRFNPINSIHSYSEPKETKVTNHHTADDDGWSDFVSIKTSNQSTKQQSTFNQSNSLYSTNQQNEEDDWSEFVSGTVLPSRSVNEVKTISQNIHSQTNNTASASFTKNATLNSMNHSGVLSITALPHLSYASSKVNSKSNFQNL